MDVNCPTCDEPWTIQIPYKNNLMGHMFLKCEKYDEVGDMVSGCGQRILIDYEYVPKIAVSKVNHKYSLQT